MVGRGGLPRGAAPGIHLTLLFVLFVALADAGRSPVPKGAVRSDWDNPKDPKATHKGPLGSKKKEEKRRDFDKEDKGKKPEKCAKKEKPERHEKPDVTIVPKKLEKVEKLVKENTALLFQMQAEHLASQAAVAAAFQPAPPTDPDALLPRSGRGPGANSTWALTTLTAVRETAIPVMKDVGVFYSFAGTIGALLLSVSAVLMKICGMNPRGAARPNRAPSSPPLSPLSDPSTAASLPVLPPPEDGLQNPSSPAQVLPADCDDSIDSPDVTDVDRALSDTYALTAEDCARLRTAFKHYRRLDGGQVGAIAGHRVPDVLRAVGLVADGRRAQEGTYGFVDVLECATTQSALQQRVPAHVPGPHNPDLRRRPSDREGAAS